MVRPKPMMCMLWAVADHACMDPRPTTGYKEADLLRYGFPAWVSSTHLLTPALPRHLIS